MLPQEFIDEVRPLLGGELDAFLRALDEPPTLALRLNPLLQPEEVEALLKARSE